MSNKSVNSRARTHTVGEIYARRLIEPRRPLHHEAPSHRTTRRRDDCTSRPVSVGRTLLGLRRSPIRTSVMRLLVTCDRPCSYRDNTRCGTRATNTSNFTFVWYSRACSACRSKSLTNIYCSITEIQIRWRIVYICIAYSLTKKITHQVILFSRLLDCTLYIIFHMQSVHSDSLLVSWSVNVISIGDSWCLSVSAPPPLTARVYFTHCSNWIALYPLGDTWAATNRSINNLCGYCASISDIR